MTLEHFIARTVVKARTDRRAATAEGYAHAVRRIASLLAWRNRAWTAKHLTELSVYGYAATFYPRLEIPVEVLQPKRGKQP